MAALVSNWGGEKLPYTMETAMVGSGHRLRIPKALATVIGGSAVLAGGEVTRVGSLEARRGG